MGKKIVVVLIVFQLLSFGPAMAILGQNPVDTTTSGAKLIYEGLLWWLHGRGWTEPKSEEPPQCGPPFEATC